MRTHFGFRSALATAALGCVIATVTGPGAASAGTVPPGDGLARRLERTVTGPAAFEHLVALQRIADRNGGVRATGTPGFAASADYVVARLTAAGYRVRRQPVPYEDYHVDAETARVLAPTSRDLRVMVMRWSPTTPAGGVETPLVVTPTERNGTPDPTPGCEPGDYSGLPVKGATVLTVRASCGYAHQQQVIADLGGRAMLLYLDTPSPGNIWRLHGFDPADYRIPVASISQRQARQLAADAAERPVRLRLDLRGHRVTGTTVNLFAETRGGRADRVVMAGAHLDSVSEGPGINDNGSSVAAILETALRLAPYQNRVVNKVSFAWWGAEELIDVGSRHYVAGLTSQQRRAIALYLNFEVLASPNFARFIMDRGGPPGSEAVARVLEHAFTDRGLPYESVDIAAIGSDHEPFATAGIPVAGMDGGTLGVKTEVEAARYGGSAGRLYDHCYHQACDPLGSINRRAFNENVPRIARTVGRFAMNAGDVEAKR